MDKNIVYSMNNCLEDFEIPRAEVLRYMASEGDESSLKLIDELLPLAKQTISPAASLIRLELIQRGDEFILGERSFKSKSLSKHLSGCEGIIVLSLSLGHALDRMIVRYSSLKPSAAFCINAIGAAAIEEYADMICKNIAYELEKEGLHLTERFSPGYGDLPLDLQETLLRLSDAQRRVGISLNKSLVMSPSKSVTALIGISSYNISGKNKGCNNCKKTNCIYREQANKK